MMKNQNLPVKIVALILFSLSFLTSSFAQQVFKTTPHSVIGYMEYVPQGYNANSDKYPIVIFLHGLGERGPNSTDYNTLLTGVPALTKLGPPKHVRNGAQFPFILVSPQLKNNYGGWSSAYIMEVVNHVKTYLRIDERRIIVTGLSLGGGGTWTMAQDYTKLFAAAAPVCGSNNTLSKACLIAAENLPIWAFHGDRDGTVPMSRSVNMVNAINNCSPTPNPKAKLTIYAGLGHNVWDRAYALDHTYHNPNIYEWMMSFTNTSNGGNKIPSANAGADINSGSTSVTVNGSGIDSDGSISSYEWIKIAGPAATLSNAATKSLTASNLASGTYIFRLRVTDNSGNSDSDYVKVTVGSGANAAPSVKAGSDLAITLPTNSVAIQGSATDADGTVSSYAWSKVSGGAATLSGTTSSKLSVSALVAGTYIFRLTAKDNDGATASDDVTVIVKSATANLAPVAGAGANLSITLPTNSAAIQGTGKDIDGTISSYLWTKVSGGAATMGGTTSSKLSLSGLAVGTYVFRLTVKDNAGASDTDDMTLTVINSTTTTSTPTSTNNVAPKAYAGKDITITRPVNYTSMQGSGTDSDGSIVSYAWTKIKGGSATMSGSTTSKVSLTGLAQGFYVFRLTVKDDKGATAYDDMAVSVK
jgi:predicted esterase